MQPDPAKMQALVENMNGMVKELGQFSAAVAPSDAAMDALNGLRESALDLIKVTCYLLEGD